MSRTVKLAQSDEVFAHPELMRILEQHAGEASKYLPELYDIQRRFSAEVNKDRSDRTVTIYNDEFYQESLRSAIRALEATGSR